MRLVFIVPSSLYECEIIEGRSRHAPLCLRLSILKTNSSPQPRVRLRRVFLGVRRCKRKKNKQSRKKVDKSGKNENIGDKMASVGLMF
jgi:hypothetical protein